MAGGDEAALLDDVKNFRCSNMCTEACADFQIPTADFTYIFRLYNEWHAPFTRAKQLQHEICT
jgi:hypothetical protein